MRCEDLAVLWPDDYAKLGCCQACHDGEAAGQDRLQARTLPDGRTAFVCCGGAFLIGRLRDRDACHEE